MRLINKLKKTWFTDKLPEVHIKVEKGSSLWIYLLHWLIHPVKRRVAKYYLACLRRFFRIKVIGITGSAGKTTTKEMIASILKLEAPAVWTKENIDPIYNIPSTILRCAPWTKYLILEMGIEYSGEMDFYLWLAKPDIGVITNIYPTHTEFLGSIDGVFREKSKLVLSLPQEGVAVLNKNDSRLRILDGKLKVKIVWFDIQSDDPLLQNARAAEAVAKVLGINQEKIRKGIVSYSRSEHRLDIIKLKNKATIFDDSYNSNPEALLVTLKVFDKLARKNEKVAVLGDMLELGKLEEGEHRRVGKEFAKKEFKAIVGVGKAVRFLLDEVNQNSPATKIYFYSTWQEALSQVRRLIKPQVFVLIKGSHSIGLDQLVTRII